MEKRKLEKYHRDAKAKSELIEAVAQIEALKKLRKKK